MHPYLNFGNCLGNILLRKCNISVYLVPRDQYLKYLASHGPCGVCTATVSTELFLLLPKSTPNTAGYMRLVNDVGFLQVEAMSIKSL